MKSGPAAFVLAIACAIPVPDAGSAQLVGDRVRVTLPGPPKIEGVVTGITPDHLELSLPGGDLRVVATGDVLRIERRAGRRQWKQGFVVGAAVGATMAVMVQPAYTGEPPSLAERVAIKLVLAAYVAPIYGIVGAAVGVLIKLPGWVPLQGWPRGGTTPPLLFDMRTMPDGSAALALGVRLQF